MRPWNLPGAPLESFLLGTGVAACWLAAQPESALCKGYALGHAILARRCGRRLGGVCVGDHGPAGGPARDAHGPHPWADAHPLGCAMACRQHARRALPCATTRGPKLIPWAALRRARRHAPAWCPSMEKLATMLAPSAPLELVSS